MPLFIAALWGALISLVGTLVGRVLVSLGIGYVTYQGADTAIAWGKSVFLSSVSGLPPLAVQVMATLKLGVCLSMLISAITARLVLAGMTSGTVKKMVVK